MVCRAIANNLTTCMLRIVHSVRADQKTQVECRDLPSARRESWRKYGSSGDATEISVKPGLILQQITDPEKLLQFWLMTADGRDARLLRAKMAKLTQKIEQAVPIFDNSNTGAEEVLKLVTAVQEPVSSILGSMNQAESFFGIVAIVVSPSLFCPYHSFGPKQFLNSMICITSFSLWNSYRMWALSSRA